MDSPTNNPKLPSGLSLTRWGGHPGKVGGYAALAMCS
jgi:hypothetical protein